VRPLVTLFRHADDADVEVVEAFDGAVEEHGQVNAEKLKN
jgi:hypothetical protein